MLVTGIQLLLAYPENHIKEKVHAKQIFVLSSSMKLGPGETTPFRSSLLLELYTIAGRNRNSSRSSSSPAQRLAYRQAGGAERRPPPCGAINHSSYLLPSHSNLSSCVNNSLRGFDGV